MRNFDYDQEEGYDYKPLLTGKREMCDEPCDEASLHAFGTLSRSAATLKYGGFSAPLDLRSCRRNNAAMEWAANPEIWISLVTLTLLEIVLGIDNIVFISILSGKLPPEQQKQARRIGLALAMVTRILLLVGLAWLVRLTKPLFTVLTQPVSGRDLILLSGGLFLLGKATHEIHDRLEGEDGEVSARVAPRFGAVVVQILLLDVVFSLDSVITAVGMVRQIPVMVAAVIIAVLFMLAFVNKVSVFIDQHPTIKMLALSFLILIGCALVAEGLHQEIPKGYIYFAMAFSLGVEMLNIRVRTRAKAKKVALHQPYR